MKKLALILISLAAATTTMVLTCNTASYASTRQEGILKDTTGKEDPMVQRGKYLVTIMGCQDCHSPKRMGPHGPEPDPALDLSGHPQNQPIGKIDPETLKSWVLFNHNATAMAGPWGVSFAANLTSDPTGIGSWTEEQFFKAIRQGKYKGLDNTRPLLPPMPWPQYARASDEDLRAIFAYLKSTKPVQNVVPAAIPPAKR
ncbi:MAG TPA: c-type cytochrome [Chitinophagaceae bacterium]|jgi:mono/diheme cytochrome c family protein|nr:c-type cytochrome [Chitinophagaceae bacterium]